MSSDEVADGIHCLPIPTPFSIGSINAYLIEGDRLTLVDNGPDVASGMAVLERLLKEIGYAVEDLDLLVVTHHHVDHMGLTGLLAERSGAEVAALDVAADFIEDWEQRQIRDDRFARTLMRRHGIETHVVDALASVAAITRGLGASTPVSTRVRAGDSLVMGSRSFAVLHRPGHSTTDTVFHDAQDELMFSGDHLLSRISSNALVTEDPSVGEGERTRPLIDYRRSLSATEHLDTRLVLGGHGPAISDPAELIDDRLAQHAERAQRILELLALRPMSAHDIASAIWGRVAFTQAFLTLSEVLGHIDLLLAEGTAVSDEADEVIRFVRA